MPKANLTIERLADGLYFWRVTSEEFELTTTQLFSSHEECPADAKRVWAEIKDMELEEPQ